MGSDRHKTKTQLIGELALVRQRLIELEATVADDKHKRIITELQKSEEKYSPLLEKSNDGIIVLQDGLVKFANSKAVEITGLSAEDVLGKPFMDFIAPQYRELVMERYRKRLAGEDVPGKYEIGLINKNGLMVSVEVNASLIVYDGKPATLSMVRDITERKRIEDALRESEARYRTLFETAAEGILAADMETKKFLYANQAICQMLGYSHVELTKMSVMDIHPRDSLEQVLADFNSIARGERDDVVVPCLKKDGTILYVNIVAASSTIGGRLCNIGFFTDVTERRKMQEQLMAQDRLASIGQLVSGVAHELNNPLTSVLGFSELLLQRELPEDVKADLRIINDEAKRTAVIVKNLLTFARKQAEGKAPFDINEQIQKVLDLRSREHTVNNIQVDTHFTTKLPPLMGNVSQFQQVFFNLVVNAEQAMVEAHHRGTLTITTERIGNTVKARFTDDGPGISPENMRKLFTPFFTTKEIGKGTGLGLSICHGIITEHGGKIYAESEPGKGATFTIELPIPV